MKAVNTHILLWNWIFIGSLLFSACNKVGMTEQSIIAKKDSIKHTLDSIQQIDLTHLYILQDSFLQLYQQNELQGYYEEALYYNEEYRTYKDSITRIVHAKGLAKARSDYEYARITEEQDQLLLRKITSQQNALVILAGILSVAAIAILGYRWRLIHQRHAIYQAQKYLAAYRAQFRTNQSTIRINEETGQILTEQFIQPETSEEESHDQQAAINRIHWENEQLRLQNEQLNKDIKTYTHQLQQENIDLSAFEELDAENDFLQATEKELTKALLEQMDLINRLKTSPQPIAQEEKAVLMDETEAVYPTFTVKLQEEFPELTEEDLLICCLIRLRFTPSEIGEIIGIEAASASKRKIRIKERMQVSKPDIWKEEPSLDAYIWKFRKYTYCLIISCLFLLFACIDHQQQKPLPLQLIQAEALIWEYPDSAQVILQQMETPETLPEEQYATWCLLYTQAQDLNKDSFSSDSLIRIALHYFGNGADIHRKATTWFYAGQVYAGMHQNVEAADAYIKALEAARATTDYRLQSLINRNYGWLCLNQGIYDEARDLLFSAQMYAELSEDEKSNLMALDYIGRYYAFNRQLDSAAFFMEKALSIAERIQDPKSLTLVLNNLSIAYYYQQMYQLAIRYLNESISISERKNFPTPFASYSNLGDIYRLIEEVDSSVFYLNKALGTNDIYLLRSCYFSLWQLNEANNNLKDALMYNKQFWLYTDSIEKVTHHKEIVELQARSATQQKQSKNEQLMIDTKRMERATLTGLIASLFGFSLLIYYYQRRLLHHKRSLSAINRQLEKEIHAYQKMCNQITAQNHQLQNRKDYLTKQLLKRMKQIALLRESPKYLTDEELRMVKLETNRIFSGFTERFHQQYPNLSDLDLLICCLIKLEFSNTTIGAMCGIMAGSVTKHKSRIKRKIQEIQPDIWEIELSLYSYLMHF